MHQLQKVTNITTLVVDSHGQVLSLTLKIKYFLAANTEGSQEVGNTSARRIIEQMNIQS